MSDEFAKIMPMIVLMLRKLTSIHDPEVLISARHMLRTLASAGFTINTLVDRIEKGGSLNTAEMQRIYDNGYTKGHDDGIVQGRKSAVLAAVAPLQSAYGSDIGVNGYSWLEIAEHCALNADRLSEKPREFVTSVFRQIQYRELSPPQMQWLADIFLRQFGGRI